MTLSDSLNPFWLRLNTTCLVQWVITRSVRRRWPSWGSRWHSSHTERYHRGFRHSQDQDRYSKRLRWGSQSNRLHQWGTQMKVTKLWQWMAIHWWSSIQWTPTWLQRTGQCWWSLGPCRRTQPCCMRRLHQLTLIDFIVDLIQNYKNHCLSYS